MLTRLLSALIRLFPRRPAVARELGLSSEPLEQLVHEVPEQRRRVRLVGAERGARA